MDDARLQALYEELGALRDYLNDEENVPERYTSTAGSALAEMDFHALSDAGRVIHRIMLWHRFPSVSPESYFKAHHPPEPVAP